MKKDALVGVSFLLITILTLSSCLKNHDNYWNDPDLQNTALISVVNGAPLSLPLDIQFNGTQRWYLNDFNYTYRTSYAPAYSGNRTFYVFNRGKSDTLVAKAITLGDRKRYSIFIVDTLSKMEAVLVRDSVMTPGADSVLLRFANMSPDAGAIDLYIQGQSTPVATGIGYKAASPFLGFKAAGNVIFEARAAGTGTVLATSDARNLFSGNQYTIWTTGFKSMNTTNGKLIVEAIRH